MTQHKLFILGIDGATFDLLDPWIEKGHLPNFAKISQRGVRQPLLSTIPTVSPVAWASMVTGKNPGKHSITDWYRMLPNTYDYIPLCGRDRQGPAIWNLLSQTGKQVGVLNVPMSYPPEAVNGFMVSGIDTPPASENYTYPKDLAPKLKSVCGQYIIDLYDDLTLETDWEKSLRRVDALLESRKKALFYLLEQYPWDFFMAVFVFADRLQHAWWSSLDPQHPHYTQEKADRLGNKILEYYIKMDNILGELLQRLGDNTNLLMVSDHGFGPCYKGVSLNKILHKMGLLKINPSVLPRKKEVFTFLNQIPGMMTLKRNPLLQKIKRKVALNIVDWSQTKAFTSISTMGNIHVNLRGLRPQGQVSMGREYEELREAIIEELKALRDPQTGVPVFAEIYKKEEIYTGEYLSEAADLMVFTHNMEYRFVDSYLKIDSTKDDNMVMELPPGFEAEHRRDGILMAWGPDIAQGKNLSPAQIMDVAPTALHLMGQAVPEDMDGQVLRNLFHEDFDRQNPVRFQKITPGIGKDSTTTPYSKEELEKIQQRLKGMGYIS